MRICSEISTKKGMIDRAISGGPLEGNWWQLPHSKRILVAYIWSKQTPK